MSFPVFESAVESGIMEPLAIPFAKEAVNMPRGAK
jgi:hypothetical protein